MTKIVRLFLVLVSFLMLQFGSAQAGARWSYSCGIGNNFVLDGLGDRGGAGAAMVSYNCNNPPGAPAPHCWQEVTQANCHGYHANASCTGISPLPNATMVCRGKSIMSCTGEGVDEKLVNGKCVKTVLTTDCGDSCCGGDSGGSGGSSGSAGSGSGGATGGMTFGHPIEIATGRKVGTYNDWNSGGDQQLYFTRYYSSFDQLTVAPAYSMIGRNWRSNFNSRALYANTNGSETTFASAATMHFAMPDGGEWSFRKVSTNWVLSVASVSTAITWPTARTDIDVALTVTAAEATLRLPNFMRYTYDTNGLLIRINFRDGYSHFLHYTPDGILASVSDSFGRRMRFQMETGIGKAGLLRSFVTPDGQTFKLTYENRFVPNPAWNLTPTSEVNASLYALKTVIYPDSTPATDADNPRKTYSYLQDYRYPFSLTNIKDELNNDYLTVGYDLSTGRAVSTELNGGKEKFTATYDDLNNKVTVINVLGRSTTYTFTKVFGSVRRLVAVDGVASTHCAAANTVYAFDANGFRSQATDAEGRLTQWTRNNRGLPTTRVEGATTASAATTTRTWDSTKPLPLTVVEPERTTTMAWNANDLLTAISVQDTTTTTVPYSTNGQTRTTAFGYQSFTQAQVPAQNPTGPALANVSVVIPAGDGSSMTGWTVVSGSMSSSTASPCTSADPCFYSASASITVVQRNVPVPAAEIANVDAGKRSAKMGWKQIGGAAYKPSGVRLVFLNASGTQIGSLVTPISAFTSTQQRERTGPIPAGTRNIRVQMLVNVSVARLRFAGSDAYCQWNSNGHSISYCRQPRCDFAKRDWLDH